MAIRCLKAILFTAPTAYGNLNFAILRNLNCLLFGAVHVFAEVLNNIHQTKMEVHSQRDINSRTFSLVQWNMLKEELSSNFNLRNMLPIPYNELDLEDAKKAERFMANVFAEEKNSTGEYSKPDGWHSEGKLKIKIHGEHYPIRHLWSFEDLSELAIDDSECDIKVEILSPMKVKLKKKDDKEFELRTLRGLLEDGLGPNDGQKVYDHINKVDMNNFNWETRGKKILERITKLNADVVVMEEYDVHFGPKAAFLDGERTTLPKVLKSLGYEVIMFDGVLGQKEGMAIFWKKDRFQLDGEMQEVVSVGEFKESSGVSNISFKVKDPAKNNLLAERLRRHLAIIRLEDKITGQKIVIAGVHLSPVSRDKEKYIRREELKQTLEYLGRLQELPIILAGDFNINIRGNSEECIFEAIRGYEATEDKRRFRLSDERLLQDVFGDINSQEICSTSKTQLRDETIDFVFFTPDSLKVETRSDLRCPKAKFMPNENEPSDHIPLKVEFLFVGDALAEQIN